MMSARRTSSCLASQTRSRAPLRRRCSACAEGARRRVLVPPALGWVSGDVNPKPPTFGAGRRLANHREEPLLMEVDLVRVRKSDEPLSEADLRDELAPGIWGGFKLPAPPALAVVRSCHILAHRDGGNITFTYVASVVVALRSFGGVFFRDNKPSPARRSRRQIKTRRRPPASLARKKSALTGSPRARRARRRLGSGRPACARRTPASRRARTRSSERYPGKYPSALPNSRGTKDTSSASAPAPDTTSLSLLLRSRVSSSSSAYDAGSAALSWNANPVAACVKWCTPVLCLSHLRPMNASSSSLPHRPDVLAAASSAALRRRRRLLLHAQDLTLIRQ